MPTKSKEKKAISDKKTATESAEKIGSEEPSRSSPSSPTTTDHTAVATSVQLEAKDQADSSRDSSGLADMELQKSAGDASTEDSDMMDTEAAKHPETETTSNARKESATEDAIEENDEENKENDDPNQDISTKLRAKKLTVQETTDDSLLPTEVRTPDPKPQGNTDKQASPQRLSFNRVRTALTCPKCGDTGLMVLNGKGKQGRIACCQGCRKRTGGHKPRELVKELSFDTPTGESPEEKRRRDTDSPTVADEENKDQAEMLNRLDTMEKAMEREQKTIANQNIQIAALIEALKEKNQQTRLQAPKCHSDNDSITVSTGTEEVPKPTDVQNESYTTVEKELQWPTPQEIQGTQKNVDGKHTDPHNGQRSWAQIARAPKRSDLTAQMNEKVSKTRESLAKAGFAPQGGNTQKPAPTPAYFAGVPRGPIRQLRKALLETHSLPSWAVLSISFIGKNICEILTHDPLKTRLITVLKLCGYRELPKYNPATRMHGNNVRNSAKTETELCRTRWLKAAENNWSKAAREWYTTAATRIAPKQKITQGETPHQTQQVMETRRILHRKPTKPCGNHTRFSTESTTSNMEGLTTADAKEKATPTEPTNMEIETAPQNTEGPAESQTIETQEENGKELAPNPQCKTWEKPQTQPLSRK